jgi:hypothetical protein
MFHNSRNCTRRIINYVVGNCFIPLKGRRLAVTLDRFNLCVCVCVFVCVCVYMYVCMCVDNILHMHLITYSTLIYLNVFFCSGTAAVNTVMVQTRLGGIHIRNIVFLSIHDILQ